MFSSYSIIAYNLIVLYLLCPKVVNDHFTLVSIINSGFLVLVPENSFLTFNIPYTSPKTARVYFGVLQLSPPYMNFVLEIKTFVPESKRWG